MHRLDEQLKDLIATGRKQGHLTFSQVNAYLPDEALTPEKLDNLLMSIEEIGMEIVPDAPAPPGARTGKKRKPRRANVIEETSRRIDDTTELCCRNLRRFLDGKPLYNRVDKRLGFPHPSVVWRSASDAGLDHKSDSPA